ncbi:MAG: hypothetical protein M1837_001339 [Sclerophora amabilis]|nr:MAG: hypothetical protein M1837_001339 [Sclerophora amabilis]
MSVPVWPRDVQSTIDGLKRVPSTLSSWDKCMSKTYCKWPVIVTIIVGSVIALSIICSPGRHKQIDDEARPPPPVFGNYGGYRPPPQPTPYEPPQYAQFDVGRKGETSGVVNPDALPAMPSWETAQQRQVADEKDKDDAIEMGKLDTSSQTMAMQRGMHYDDASAGYYRGRELDHSYDRDAQVLERSPSNTYMPGAQRQYSNGSGSAYSPAGPGYAAHSPYHYQESGVTQVSTQGRSTPNAWTPGRQQQGSWTVV